jgi:hypothetical protein
MDASKLHKSVKVALRMKDKLAASPDKLQKWKKTSIQGFNLAQEDDTKTA